ncbi:hypothetical protein PMAYCL1PPCAC_22143, partial [Pristionchus mayeri]
KYIVVLVVGSNVELLGSMGSLLEPLGQFGMRAHLLLEVSHLIESVEESGDVVVEDAHVIDHDEIDPSERRTDEMTIKATHLVLLGEDAVELVSRWLGNVLLLLLEFFLHSLHILSVHRHEERLHIVPVVLVLVTESIDHCALERSLPGESELVREVSCDGPALAEYLPIDLQPGQMTPGGLILNLQPLLSHESHVLEGRVGEEEELTSDLADASAVEVGELVGD